MFAKTLLAAALATATILPAATADACGGYTLVSQESLVRNTVTAQAHALRTGERKALLRYWDANGRTIMVGPKAGKPTAVTESITRASRRWTRNPDKKATIRVDAVKVTGNVASVQATVTWHGDVRSEHLTLMKLGGQWKIVSKVHTRKPAAAVAIAAKSAGLVY